MECSPLAADLLVVKCPVVCPVVCRVRVNLIWDSLAVVQMTVDSNGRTLGTRAISRGGGRSVTTGFRLRMRGVRSLQVSTSNSQQ